MLGDLWKLEEAFFTDRHTAAFVDEVVAEDAIVVTEQGRMTKAEWMAAVATPAPQPPYELTEKDGLLVSENVVVLSYVATRFPEDKQPDTRMMSSVYMRVKDGWALMLHQQTPVQGSAGESGQEDADPAKDRGFGATSIDEQFRPFTHEP